MKKDWKREYFSIPNLMGYFRLILIPVYLMVYIHADGMKDYAIAAGILLLFLCPRKGRRGEGAAQTASVRKRG